MKIHVNDYKNKTYGAWFGKCAGGLIGAKQENNKGLLGYCFDNVFPDEAVPNDDFDLQILYLQEVLEKKGFNFDERDLADAFCKHNKCWANEYRVAIRNIDSGIYPPSSGSFSNEYFKNSNGCPIRSEIWATCAPGDPELACLFVGKDGFIDHTSDSVDVEKFFACMESNAYFESDLEKLMDISMKFLDKGSRVYECINFVRRERAKNDDWRLTRNRLIREYGSTDASYSIVNMGIVLIALLYGKKNFNDTLLTAVNCGYDTDCSAATAGAILGIILGKDGIDAEWQRKTGDKFVIGTVDITRSRNSLSELTDDVFNLAYSLFRDGVSSVEFSGVDEGYVCPVPRYDPPLNIKTVYNGEPVIRPGQSKTVTLIVRNDGNKKRKTGIKGYESDNLILNIEAPVVEIEPSGERIITLEVSVTPSESMPNAVKADVFFYGDYDRKITLGFAGEAEYKLYGPFFDVYDTEKYDHDVNGQTTPKDVFSMFNGFASINREYLEEDAELSNDHKVFYSAEDKLPVEGNVGYKGTCCVYVKRKFICAEEKKVHMIFGYAQPCKVYLNGETVFENYDNVNWMPLNFAIEANLKKGENTLVYKLIRRNGEFEFSNIISQIEFGRGVLVPLENVYEENAQ